LVGTTTTSGTGAYGFSNLAPGTYYVKFFAPLGYVFTTADSGSDATDSDANTGTGKTGTYTLASGQTNNTVDAGLYRPASIGDFVWEDSNGNGVQDSGEPGIDGVTVKLLDGAGALITSTLTHDGGAYSFDNLRPGVYSVQFVAPGGYTFTKQNIGADDTRDSDADTGTGKAGPYTLDSGEQDYTADVRLLSPGEHRRLRLARPQCQRRAGRGRARHRRRDGQAVRRRQQPGGDDDVRRVGRTRSPTSPRAPTRPVHCTRRFHVVVLTGRRRWRRRARQRRRRGW
jgi:hypothetical protein